MKPKKRERASAPGPVVQLCKPLPLVQGPSIHNQTDHDLFLQAFEKPTQIYRFLKCRQMASPVFLPRTLSYMFGRSTRKANTRSTFRVEELLARVEAANSNHQVHRYKSEHLNITFTGFYSEDLKDAKEAKVDLYLVKVLHKKRKDSSTSIQPTCIGSSLVPCNPSSNHSVAASPSSLSPTPTVDAASETKYAVSIAAEKFCSNGSSVGTSSLSSGSSVKSQDGENGVKSCVLVIRVTTSDKAAESGSFAENGNTVPRATDVSPRRSSSASDSENQQPPRKRLRSSRDSSRLSDGAPVLSAEGSASYSVQLEVYDRYQRCLLSDGTYVLQMSPDDGQVGAGRERVTGRGGRTTGRGRRMRTWETVNSANAHKVDTTLPVSEIMFKSTQLRFVLSWSNNSVQKPPAPRGGGLEDLYPPLSACEVISTQDDNLYDIKRIPSVKMLKKNSAQGNSRWDNSKDWMVPGGGKKPRIFYQFLYNTATRQQTEVTEELRCPWCSLVCPRLHALLSHLRCSHSRFCFTYIEHPKAGRIDVSVNDQFDGSYVGNPQDLRSQLGFTFRRSQPVQRLPVTLMLVARPKKKRRRRFDMTEFQEPELEGSKIRHTVQGHNRLYYHTLTSQPVRPCDIEEDSEDELDPEWLRLKTHKMIEEFSDVNEGEKEIMKMWNLHVMKRGYVGDCQVPGACAAFIAESAAEILRRNLTRNLILHLVNLSDFGLIGPEIVYRTAVQFLQLTRQLEERSTSLDAASGRGKFSTPPDLIDSREESEVFSKPWGDNGLSKGSGELGGNRKELPTHVGSENNCVGKEVEGERSRDVELPVGVDSEINTSQGNSEKKNSASSNVATECVPAVSGPEKSEQDVISAGGGTEKEVNISLSEVVGSEKESANVLKERCTRSVSGRRNSATGSRNSVPLSVESGQGEEKCPGSVNTDGSDSSVASGRRNSIPGRLSVHSSTKDSLVSNDIDSHAAEKSAVQSSLREKTLDDSKAEQK